MTWLPFLLCFSAPRQETEAPAAVDTGIDLTIRHCFEPFVIGIWQPYVCDVHNRSGRERRVTIRLISEYVNTISERSETLPAGGRKRIYLYLATPGSQSLKYEMVEEGGPLLASGDLRPLSTSYSDPDRVFVVALVSTDPSSLTQFSIPDAQAGLDIVKVRAEPSRLPDRWIGYSSVHLLVLHGISFSDLTSSQVCAVADYVRSGGSLLLVPGPDPAWFRQEAVAQFADIRTSGTREVDRLPSLEKNRHPLEPRQPFLWTQISNGEWILREPDAPTLAAYRNGFGRVLVLPFDLRREPFLRWPGLEVFWSQLLGAARSNPASILQRLQPAADDNARFRMLNAVASLVNPLPSFLMISVLLSIYILAVGPVNFMLLQRWKLTMLLPVTIPAISVAFLLGIVGLGYLVKGTSVIADSLVFLSAFSGDETATETRLVSVYSPSARSYTIRFDEAAVATRYNPGRDRALFRTDWENGFSIREASTGQWESILLAGRAVRGVEGGIFFSTDGISATVENHTSMAILHSLFVDEDGNAHPVGPVPSGRRVQSSSPPSPSPLTALGIPARSPAAAALQEISGLWNSGRGRQPQKRVPFLLCEVDRDPGRIELDVPLSSAGRTSVFLQIFEDGHD